MTHPHNDGPAFTTIDGLLLTTSGFIGVLRLALMVTGHPAPFSITAHSLRRAGAQACPLLGLKLDDIKELGNWTSDAVQIYLTEKPANSASKSLVEHFA